MRYSLAPPLVLEAAYLVASAPVDLPVILFAFDCDWCLLFGPCLDLFSPGFYGVVSPATCGTTDP